MKKKVCVFFSILLVFGIAVCFASCDLSSLFSTNETGGSPNVPPGPVDPNDPPVNPNTPPVDPYVPPVVINQTPFPIDYTIGNMNQTEGSVTAVAITAKEGKSPGAISNIKYNGSATIPQVAGYYAVAFDVAAASGWNAASGLLAGTLTVTQPGGGSPPVNGGGQNPDGLIYTETATAVTIIGYVGTSKNISIPSPINGKPVTTIGNGAFYQKQLTGVIIPNSVITIGEYAFCYNNLTSVLTIPNSVTTIGEWAFIGNQLTSVAIPNSVTTLGEHAFAFNKLTSVSIPGSVTTIGEYAFYDNQLTSVSLSNGITTIERWAFARNKLQSVNIPNSVTTIGWEAFNQNPLTSVTIGSGVTTTETLLGYYNNNELVSVNAGAFPLALDDIYINYNKQAGTYTRANTSTEFWTLQGAATQTPVPDDYTFDNMSQTANSVTAVTITANTGKSPGAVSNIKYNNSTTIPQNAGTYAVTFDVAAATGWSAATGLSAGNLVVSSNSGSSQDASDFIYTETATVVTITGYRGTSKDVTIPAQINEKPVTTIGGGAFKDKQLTSVTIPDSVTTILMGINNNVGAFQGNQLTSITIPDSVKTIGGGAFRDNQLTRVAIGNSVTTIGQAAFHNNQLTSVTIPDSVTIIESYAFYYNNLTTVSIGNSVTTIGQQAFCTNQLTSVTIPDSVTAIGDEAFYDNKLTTVAIGSSVKTIGAYAFCMNQLISVTIPDSVTTIRNDAFHDNKLASVTIGNGVTSIGEWAFYYNPPLTSVTIGAGVQLSKSSYPSFPDGLDSVYNNGKLAGRYTRPNTSSTAWTRQES